MNTRMYYNRLIGSLLFVKLSIILILMLSIHEVISCWGPSSTKLGVATPDPKLLVGTQLSIDCTLFNNTIEYNNNVCEVNSSMISFKFNSKYYPEDKIHLINDTVAQLTVDKASVDDNGMYYCLLNISGLDHNPLVCVSHVTVGYKPQNVKDFKCISLHYRKLHCSWTPQENPIETHYYLEDRMHATLSPKYDYLSRKCGFSPTENSCEWSTDTVPPFRNTAQKFYLVLVGENQFGKNDQLFVIEHYSIIKPNIPKGLTYSNVTTNNMTLSWKAPEYIEFDEDLLKHIIYEIRYFRIDSYSNNANSQPIIIDGIRETRITLTDLIPFNIYNVSIRCKTIQSIKDEYWSEYSSVLVTTKPDVPYLSPVLIPESFQTVKNTEGNRSITLFWKPIPIEHHNALGFHYSIEYRQKYRRVASTLRVTNSLYYNPVNVKSDNTTYTFILMDSNTAYNFKIYGVNDKGMSKNFSEITVDKNDNIPHKPTNIDVFSYGGGRYEVQWGQPRDNSNSGSIVNYTVFWCQNLRPRPFPCEGAIDWTHTTNRSITLELPDIKVNYQFAVSANAQKSSSGMSWAECIVPIDGRLDKLSEVRLDVLNSTSINVIWKLNCPAQKRVVEGYKITYCKTEHLKELNQKMCNKPKSVTVYSYDENYVLNSLEPYSEYKITVVALTDSGPSDESDPKYAETPHDSPTDAPSNLRANETTSDSITLTWKPPLIPNGQILHYDIVCNDKVYNINASSCSNGCSYKITGLSSYRSYRLKVRACNSKSLCSQYTSDAFSMRTLTSTPSQMDPPRTEIINATSARVSWSPPIEANGPIDYYLLKLVRRDNLSEPKFYNISAVKREYYLSLDCNSYIDDSMSYQQQFAVSIVAVNHKRNEKLVGNYSDFTNLNACLIADENREYIIGIIAGGTLGLMLFVMVLYMLVRWMKRKINAYNSLRIELPKGLEAPQLVTDPNDEAELNRTDSSPNLVSDNTLPVMTDEDSFKNRHGSGISQVSTSSTEGLIIRMPKAIDGIDRMISTDSGQNGHMSSDSGVEIDAQLNPKDPNELLRANKVGPKPPLPILDEISSRHSDSSGSRDSGFEITGTRVKRKKRQKSTKSNKIHSQTRNEVINPLYDCPVNHMVCIYSLLANSEPSLYDLPVREDDNILSDLTKFYKPEMAKSLSSIIQNSSPSDPKMNCIICDSINSSSKSSTRTASPNNHPYYKFGNYWRQIHVPTNSSEKKNETNNGYIPIDSILNNSEPNPSKPLKRRLQHDSSQNSYDAEVSSTSSNGDNEQTTDIITPTNLFNRSSANFSECEKIQNIPEFKANGEHNPINSSVNPLNTSPKDLSLNSSAVEGIPALSETKSLNTASHESKTPMTSPNHFSLNSNGYVLHNSLTPQLSANKVKANRFIKNANGYVVIKDGIEMRNAFVPNNTIVDHMTQV